MKALKVLFLVVLFPSVAAIWGFGIGIWVCDYIYVEHLGCFFPFFGAALSIGISLVVYLAWVISYLLRKRRENALQ